MCVHAVWVFIHTSLSLSIAEASFWTPSYHAMMWMECDHPLAREPGWAKGISHRHANSTNAPVRPKWQILSAMGFSCLFLHVSATSLWERSVAPPAFPQMQLTLCGNSQASTIDVVWFLGYSVWGSRAGRSVNTTQGQEVCHHSFPDRRKWTAVIEMTMAKLIAGNQFLHRSQRVQFKLCRHILKWVM